MSYDYTYKKPLSELRFYAVVNQESAYSDWLWQYVMQPALAALHQEYGITFATLQAGELPAPAAAHELVYVAYGPTNPLAMPATEQLYLQTLAGLGYWVNILSAYPLTADGQDAPGYEAACTVVPELCDRLAVNAVFPDSLELEPGIRTVDWEDLRDNVIGETIRVKYEPYRTNHAEDHELLLRLHDRHASDISHLARLFGQYKLWQRAVTDGAILFTHDGFWYCSQTKTPKNAMTSYNYSLITSFDESANAITYTGRKLPSSDAPEQLLLSSLLSMRGWRPPLIVHFHHYELTRGPRFRQLLTDEKLEYGQFITGRRISQDLRSKHTYWLIMLEHGVIWVGDSVEMFEQFLHDIGLTAINAGDR